MQDRQLFEYAVIRVVPRVEREEFLNVGVVLYAHQPKFLQARFSLKEERLRAFNDLIDWEEIAAALHTFEMICKGGKDAGPIGELDTASRFRWLTAPRSTILQTSKVHPGLCPTPALELDRLFEELVL